MQVRSCNRAQPADADERQRIVQSTASSCLVEAAAGTGKTTLIVDRLVKGIRDGSYRMSRTVAITFTEKAAGELEARLRARLAECAASPAVPGLERERCRQALGELDRAYVCTIHAFCAGLLRQKPAEAGVDPQFQVLDETQAELLRQSSWRQWMELEAARPEPVLVEALRAGVRVRDLEAIGRALVAAPELWEDPRFQPVRPSTGPDELVAQFGQLAAQVCEVCQKWMGKGNADSRAILRAAREAAQAAGTSPGLVRRAAYSVAGTDPAEAARSFRESCRPQVEPLLEQFVVAAGELGAHLACDVFLWLRGFQRHYAEAKRAQSALDFQDLLALAARLLRTNLAVRRYFQRHFDAFFVDEFQDTDPLQAELVAYLCEDPLGPPAGRMEDVRIAEGKLVVVGDPKQSIYRFRRADVQVYERFKELMGKGRLRRVYCNFRSDGALLDWFNAFFREVFSRPRERGVYQAEHIDLVPPPTAARAQGPCVLALAAQGDDIASKVLDARRREAKALAALVKALVEGSFALPGQELALRYGDFAFLLRALTDADVYEDALDAQGIPYRVVGGKHFYRREQVVETLALLRAVDDPLDEPAIVGALRSSFFGLSDEDLCRYRRQGGVWNYLATDVRDGPVGEAMKLLARWHLDRNRVPPQVLLRRALEETAALESFRHKPAGQQRAANVEKIENQLRALWPTAGSFSAAVRYLRGLEEGELPEEESSVVEPGEDFVQVLTMHKAKGLQFNAVVLPDLFRDLQAGRQTAPLLFNRIEGRMAVRLKNGLQSGGYEELRREEAGNEAAERERLFYVACTRARRLLVLPLYWLAKAPASSFERLLLDFGRLPEASQAPLGRQVGGVLFVDGARWLRQEPAAPAALEREERPVEELLRERESWSGLHARLVEKASAGERFVHPSALEEDLAAEPLAEESAVAAWGRDFGSLFHRVMAAAPLKPAGPADEARVLKVASAEAEALGLDGAAAQEATHLVLQALRLDEFRQLLDEAGTVEREVPFCVQLAALGIFGPEMPGFVEGTVDLLATGGQRAIVLDYKTDRFLHGRQAAEDRYWPQVALYALAARAAGYIGQPPELVLFFVREGTLSRRSLDEGLLERVRRLIQNLVGQTG